MSETWMVNPDSGDYVMDSSGKPVLDKGLKVPAYLRLKTTRGAWLYAPDNAFGSDYRTIGRRVTSQDNNLVQNITEKALKPLLDDGRASEIGIELKEATRHTTQLNVKIRDAQGRMEQLIFNPIGAR